MQKSNRPIKDHIRDFLDYLDIEKGLGNRTQETYSRLLDRFLSWLKKNNLENIKPHELNEENVWNFRVYLSQRINSKTKEPLKKTSQNYYLIALRNLLKFFTDRNIQSFPAEKIKLVKLKSDERAVKFLDLDQIKKLLGSPNPSTLMGLRDRSILETFFSTGLRISELVSLNRDQIKIEDNTEDLEVVVIGKGNRPRPVYISSRAVKGLKEYLNTRNDKEKALFINYKGPKNASKRLSVRSVENIVKKYTVMSGLPSFTVPHTLRHSFATDLLSQGVDLREVQEFLGHKNIATTQIYAHVTSKRLKDIHRKFHGGGDIEK